MKANKFFFGAFAVFVLVCLFFFFFFGAPQARGNNRPALNPEPEKRVMAAPYYVAPQYAPEYYVYNEATQYTPEYYAYNEATPDEAPAYQTLPDAPEYAVAPQHASEYYVYYEAPQYVSEYYAYDEAPAYQAPPDAPAGTRSVYYIA